MLFSISQDGGSGTDFLKKAITYGQTDGLASDLWRVDDVSVCLFPRFSEVALTQFSLCEPELGGFLVLLVRCTSLYWFIFYATTSELVEY